MELKERIVAHLKQWKFDLVADLEKEFPGENVEQAIIDLQTEWRLEEFDRDDMQKAFEAGKASVLSDIRASALKGTMVYDEARYACQEILDTIDQIVQAA